jgi:phenylalanyl-tRNA synthetase alpha chain
MLEKICEIRKRFEDALTGSGTYAELEAAKVRFVGRKGEVTELFKAIKDVAPEVRKEFGQELNRLKKSIEERLAEKMAVADTGKKVFKQDYTLPGYQFPIGKKHPLTQTLDDIKAFFLKIGFTIADGPEIETDYYNFEALNIPRDHPARNMQDSLFIEDEIVLRTHTSPVQIRVMEKQRPPIRIIAPGRVYRRDTPDASHSPFFHQVEGLTIDKNTSFADLKGLIQAFAAEMFGTDIKVRFRPSFFPFTEPSLEYDFNCVFCRGKGCRVCQQSGWLEISGAGMVDPNVFKFVDYDPDIYSGYAFGMGVDRIAMLRYGITDIRMLFENDLRFLAQF